MNKDFPEIIIDSAEEKVETGANPHFEYSLELFDSNGIKTKDFSAINEKTKAILTIYVSQKGDKYPDKDSWLTYKFNKIKGLEKKPGEKLKISEDMENEFLKKKRRLHGELIRKQTGVIGEERLIEESNISYKIQKDSCNASVRVDIYQKGNPSNAIEITDKDHRLDIKLEGKKKIQANLENDGIEVVPKETKGFGISPGGYILGALLFILLLGFVFRHKIINWIKRKKKKSHVGEDLPDDLGIY